MTTKRRAPNPLRWIRPEDRPAHVHTGAAGWLAAGFVALVLPFAVLVGIGRPPPGGFTWDFAMGLGFAGLMLAALQFALTGRLRPLTHPFGADIVYVFHRFLSWGAVALMLGHFGVLYLWHQEALGVLNPLEARWELTSGRLALLCFGLLILTSELRKRLGIEYLAWRIIHVGLAVIGFAAAVAHVLGVGNVTGPSEKQALWLAVTLCWVGLLVWTRLWRPWRQLANPWRVVENRPERGGVRTLVLEPQGRPLEAWKPGQFAWLAVGSSPFSLREHPFTIADTPENGPPISFSIKALGDDSRRLAETPVGSTAYVDGPFGVFSVDREPDAGGFVMIAGGIGVTPILSNLRALALRRDPRPVILIYANPAWDDVPFREDLDALRQQMDLRVVHVLEEAPDGFEGETGRVGTELLRRNLPEPTRDWPHLLCGPPAMLAAVIAALQEMGVPRHRIENEIFEMV
jgi:predicted ferric reductase